MLSDFFKDFEGSGCACNCLEKARNQHPQKETEKEKADKKSESQDC